MAARQDEDELRPSKSTKEAKRTSRMEIDRGKLPIRPGSYVHLCILQLRTPNGLEEDVSNEFAEITCISWTLVDLLEKEVRRFITALPGNPDNIDILLDCTFRGGRDPIESG